MSKFRMMKNTVKFSVIKGNQIIHFIRDNDNVGVFNDLIEFSKSSFLQIFPWDYVGIDEDSFGFFSNCCFILSKSGKNLHSKKPKQVLRHSFQSRECSYHKQVPTQSFHHNFQNRRKCRVNSITRSWRNRYFRSSKIYRCFFSGMIKRDEIFNQRRKTKTGSILIKIFIRSFHKETSSKPHRCHHQGKP